MVNGRSADFLAVYVNMMSAVGGFSFHRFVWSGGTVVAGILIFRSCQKLVVEC